RRRGDASGTDRRRSPACTCARLYTELCDHTARGTVPAPMTTAFASIEDVVERFAGQDYICNRTIGTVVYLASHLQKPILVEGPAGVGKTELAKVLAGALGQPLLRLQCYEGLDEAK